MRPLRSLMIGDCDCYLSPLIFGVAQGMSRLGHWHSQVSIRQPIDVIKQRVLDLQPDILWTHMLLWAPAGSPPLVQLLDVVTQAAKRGAKVIIHDGDYKAATRHPESLADWCALALCNHRFDRSAWRVPTLHWPYFAFAQDRIADADPALGCDLYFAGQLSTGPVYAERTKLIAEVGKRVNLRLPGPRDGNTLFRTAEIAASAGAVLGFGRPGVSGWVDTRVFQYGGAGAILVHDDAAAYLDPGVHFVPYRSGSASSVVEAVERVKAMSPAERLAMRLAAFSRVQTHHSSVARVRQVLSTVGLT